MGENETISSWVFPFGGLLTAYATYYDMSQIPNAVI